MTLELLNEIKAATLNGLRNLKDKHPKEDFCAFGLYSDEGAMTVCLAANTATHLKKNAQSSPDEYAYYKWMMPEWKYEDVESSCFNEIVAKINSHLKSIDSDEEFEKFQNSLFNACVQSLEEIKAKGLFGDALVLFQVTDFEDDEKLIGWADRLNEKNQVKEYVDLINE